MCAYDHAMSKVICSHTDADVGNKVTFDDVCADPTRWMFETSIVNEHSLDAATDTD